MSRLTWDLIKKRSDFHVNLYRRELIVLLISLLLSTAMVVLIFYLYLNVPQRDFYATDGITPPIKLNPLMEPNNSPVALLEPDPPEVVETKKIPE